MPKNTPLRSIDNRTLYSGAVLTGGGGSGAGTGIPSDAAGAGLTFDGTALNVGAGDGITVAADSVGLASSLAGGGLTYMSGVLAVGAGSGITVNADDIALAASTAGAGLTYTSGVLAVGVATTFATSGAGGGLSAEADAVRLTASSNPGATAAVLASTSAGGLTLQSFTSVGIVSSTGASGGFLLHDRNDIADNTRRWVIYADSNRLILYRNTTTEYLLGSGGGITTAAGMTLATGAAGDLTFNPAGVAKLASGKVLQSSTFVSGFAGSGWRIDDGVSRTGYTAAEMDDLVVRGILRVYELLIHKIRTGNGSYLFANGGKVATVAGAGPYTLTFDEDHGLAVNDLIRAQKFTGSGTYQSNCTVTAVPTTKTATVTLSSGSAPAAGYEYVRLGNTTDTTRQGGVYVTADDSNAPYLDIYDGVGSFADFGGSAKIKSRLGKLTGITGTANQYGALLGNLANANVLIDGSGGVQLRQGTTAVIALATSGASYFAGPMTIGTSGGIYQGTGTFAAPTTGLKIWNDGGIGRIAGYSSGSLQWYAGTNGKLQFGADKGVLDAAGMALYYDSSASPGTESSIIWYNTPSTRTGQIGYISFGDDAGVYAPEVAALDRGHALRIKSMNAIIPSIIVQSTGDSGTVWHSANDGTGSGLDADKLDNYEASAFGQLAASQTWTDTQYFSKSNGIGFDVRVDTSGVSKGFRIVTTGALATSTDTDQFQFYHVADNLWAMYSGDSSGYRGMVLNPSGGNVGIGTGTTAPAYRLEVNGTAHIASTLTAGGAIGGTWSTMATQGTNGTVSGRNAESRRFGDITFLRGAINPADDSGPLDLVQIATTTHRPARTQYLVAMANTGTVRLQITTTGMIICENATTSIDWISFDGLHFFNT